MKRPTNNEKKDENVFVYVVELQVYLYELKT